VDAEQKSANIEFLITGIYSNLVDLEDVYQIVTSSFKINFYKTKSSNTLVEFKNNIEPSFELPYSICNLAKNCAKNQFLTIKVIN
jgi:hypothetical protein